MASPATSSTAAIDSRAAPIRGRCRARGQAEQRLGQPAQRRLLVRGGVPPDQHQAGRADDQRPGHGAEPAARRARSAMSSTTTSSDARPAASAMPRRSASALLAMLLLLARDRHQQPGQHVGARQPTAQHGGQHDHASRTIVTSRPGPRGQAGRHPAGQPVLRRAAAARWSSARAAPPGGHARRASRGPAARHGGAAAAPPGPAGMPSGAVARRGAGDSCTLHHRAAGARPAIRANPDPGRPGSSGSDRGSSRYPAARAAATLEPWTPPLTPPKPSATRQPITRQAPPPGRSRCTARSTAGCWPASPPASPTTSAWT